MPSGGIFGAPGATSGSSSGPSGGIFGAPTGSSTPTKKKSRKKKFQRVHVEALLKAAKDNDIEKFYAIGSQMELTSRQMKIAWDSASETGKNRSFGDSLKGFGKGALGGATWTLDKLMRPSWAVSAATSEALEGDNGKSDLLAFTGPLGAAVTAIKDPGRAKDIASAAISGLKGETRKGFGEVLDEQGILKGHATARGAVGFGLDVATDPLMALTVAGAPVTGGGSIAAYTAAKASATGASKKLLQQAAREAGEKALKGEIDDIAEEILKEGGKSYQHRLALMQQNKAIAAKPIMQMDNTDLNAFMRESHIAESMAKAESRLYDPRKLQILLGTQKHGLKLNTHIPILTRPGAKLAEKQIPIISQLSDRLGRAFVPGFKNDIFRAGELSRQHAGEFNAVVQRDAAMRIFDGIDKALSEDDMLDALHYMQQPLKRGKGKWKAVVPDGTGGFTPNSKYLDKLQQDGILSDIQRDFIERWHKTTSYLNHLDTAAGLGYKNYEATGRMYVPHVIRQGVDANNVVQTSLTTKAGFEHGKDVVMSLKQIREQVENGQMDDLFEMNPMMALARRSRAGAERQADMALINSLRASIGVPARLVDPKKVKRVEARIDAATKKLEAGKRVVAAAEKDYEDKIQAVESELETVYTEGKRIFDKQIAARRKEAKQEVLDALQAKLKRARKPETKAAIQKEINRVKHTKFTNPYLDKSIKNFEKVTSDYQAALKSIRNPQNQAHKDAVGEHALTLQTAKEIVDEATSEARVAVAALAKAKRGKRNPAVTRDMVKIGAVLDEFDNEYFFPKEAKASVLRLRRLISGDDQTVDDFARGVGKWMGGWKILVTTVNPGYRFRNTMTDYWNMWVAGVPNAHIGKYSVQAARTMKAMKDPSHPNYIEAFRMIHEASDHGIMSGLFAGDIQSVAQMLKHQTATKRGLLKEGKPLAATTKLAQDINRNAENWGRLTHYLYRRRELGESASEAAFRVKIAHFDYEDLTDFEQRVMKKIFPFYTWTRKNIPYQVRQILAEPGRYSAFPKLAQEAEYAATGGESSGDTPEFVTEAFGFKVPFGENNFFMPQFGVSDLEVFQGGDESLQRVASSLNPALKLPAELYLNKSFFTKTPIESDIHPRNPVSEIGADVLSLIPGSNVGQTSRTGPGMERLTGPGADPQLVHLAGQIPWLRNILINSSGIKSKQTDKAGLLSQAAGLSFVNVDPELNRYYQKLEVEAQVDKMIQGLRDEGSAPLNPRKQTAFDKLIDEILQGNY